MPRQWYGTAGVVAGLAAAVPSAALLWISGAVESLSRSTSLAEWGILALWMGLLAFGGLLYGRVFRRAADDPRGSWLFGISYGFLMWTLGPIVVLQWVLHRALTPGLAGIGLLGAYLVYGLVLGLLFVPLRKRLQPSLDRIAGAYDGSLAPRHRQVNGPADRT